MLLDRLFRPRPAKEMGRALYASVVDQSRAPGLYADLGAPDTVEGRFEIYTLHTVLLLDRLREQGEQARETSQALFDAYLKALDHALRELGVGDLSVGRKMRRLGEAFYGRVKSYVAAFDHLPQTDDLEALLARTVYEGVDAPPSGRLAAYVTRQRAQLADQPLENLLAGDIAWSPA